MTLKLYIAYRIKMQIWGFSLSLCMHIQHIPLLYNSEMLDFYGTTLKGHSLLTGFIIKFNLWFIKNKTTIVQG